MIDANTPFTLKEALSIIEKTKNIPFAGGTDIMVKYRTGSGIPANIPEPIIFLNRIEELTEIEKTNKEILIGSCVRLSSLLHNQVIPECLKTAVSHIASPPVRNAATLGGNICNASPAGDTIPPLLCMDASLVIEKAAGSRVIPIEQFITGPGRTDLSDNELLTRIIIPIKDFNILFYRKIGTRKANALSKLSFTGLAFVKNSRIEDIRIAFGATGPKVIRSREIERQITGITIHEVKSSIGKLKKMYAGLIVPIDDQRSTKHYRKITALRLLEQFLTIELCNRGL